MKSIINTLLITTFVTAYSFSSLAEQELPRQNTLQYYCNGPDLEFEQQVQVADSYRIHLNQGAFIQVEEPTRYPAHLAFVEQQMVRAGIQVNCAEYLLLHTNTQYLQKDELLARVYFSFDSAELTGSSRYLLSQIVARLQQSEQLKVEGHTDNIGSDAYNFSLGLRRSQSVAEYLQQQLGSQLAAEVTSFGERKPIATNTTEQGREQNRRVDIY